MTCPTTSGPYRCTRGDAGHAGECECSAPEYRAACPCVCWRCIKKQPDHAGCEYGCALLRRHTRKTSEGAAPLTTSVVLSTPGGGSEEPGTILALAKRVRVLEEQVASLQMAAPRGIPR